MKPILIIILTSVLLPLAKAGDSLSIYRPYILEHYKKAERIQCDACGCSIGGASSGFESILNPQFIGIKYLFQKYESKAYEYDKHYSVPEYYNTIQIWGRFPVIKNLDVYASLPYHAHERKTNPKQNISGIGDLSAMAIYKLRLDSMFHHRLNVGFGVKIPIAKFDRKLTESYNPSFQLGTGSWDYAAIINYTYAKNSWAVALSTDYTFKNQNSKYYRFGDQWNSSLTGYYIHHFNNFSISPRLGMATERYFPNVEVGERLSHTGGYLVLWKMGAEMSIGKFNIGVENQMPIVSKLSEDRVRIRGRNSVYINFNL